MVEIRTILNRSFRFLLLPGISTLYLWNRMILLFHESYLEQQTNSTLGREILPFFEIVSKKTKNTVKFLRFLLYKLCLIAIMRHITIKNVKNIRKYCRKTFAKSNS